MGRNEFISEQDAEEMKQYVKRAARRIAKLEKQIEWMSMPKNWKHSMDRSGRMKWAWRGETSPTANARVVLREKWND